MSIIMHMWISTCKSVNSKVTSHTSVLVREYISEYVHTCNILSAACELIQEITTNTQCAPCAII